MSFVHTVFKYTTNLTLLVSSQICCRLVEVARELEKRHGLFSGMSPGGQLTHVPPEPVRDSGAAGQFIDLQLAGSVSAHGVIGPSDPNAKSDAVWLRATNPTHHSSQSDLRSGPPSREAQEKPARPDLNGEDEIHDDDDDVDEEDDEDGEFEESEEEDGQKRWHDRRSLFRRPSNHVVRSPEPMTSNSAAGVLPKYHTSDPNGVPNTMESKLICK